MFEDLNAFLDFPHNEAPENSFILIKDAAPSGEGALLLHHFISYYSRAGCGVCLVGFEQGLDHYASVCRRMGTNLSSQLKSGDFVFVDAFTRPYTSCASEEHDEDQAASKSQGLTFSVDLRDLSLSVRRLLEILIPILDEFARRDKPSCLLFDSLHAFLDVSRHEQATVLDLLHYLNVLSSEHSRSLSVVVLAQAPPAPLPSPDISIRRGEGLADLVLEVSPLLSGHSTAVHGQLLVRLQNPKLRWRRSGRLEASKLLHFRTRDSSISFFPPGHFK